MLEAVKRFLFGDGETHSPIEGIPKESRDAHHQLLNTTMKMRKVADDIDGHVNDILEVLARDIKHRGSGSMGGEER